MCKRADGVAETRHFVDGGIDAAAGSNQSFLRTAQPLDNGHRIEIAMRRKQSTLGEIFGDAA